MTTKGKRFNRVALAAAASAVLLFGTVAFAWTGPPASPPNSNASAPVNVGSTLQEKVGGFYVSDLLESDSLAVYGNAILGGASRYLNWGTTLGTSGYGIRDNAGTLEFKNNGGSWTSFASGGSLTWLASGNNIYNTNSGNVGIGTATPGATLTAIRADGTGNAAIIFGNDQTNKYGILDYNDTSDFVSIQGGAWGGTTRTLALQGGGGNVAIGTTVASAKLHVYGNAMAASTAGSGASVRNSGLQLWADNAFGSELHYGQGGAQSSGWATALYGRSGETVALRLGAYAGSATAQSTFSEFMTILNSGYVGIGAPAPARTLDVFEKANSAAYKEVARFSIANNAGGTNFSRLLFGQTAANSMFIEAADQANTKGVLQLQPYGAGKVTIGNTAATHKLSVLGNAVSGSHAIYGVTGISDSATHGVLGASGIYWAGLGRSDGYSFVGSGSLYNNGSVQATSFLYISDARLKKNVKALDAGLVALMKLKPVSFTWKEDATGMEGMKDPRAGTDDIGLIAQEVEEIIPGIVSTNAQGVKSVDYVRLVPVLIKAMQEQQAHIDLLETRLKKLEGTN